MFKTITLIDKKPRSERLQDLVTAVNVTSTSVERTFNALTLYASCRVVEINIAKKQAQLGVLSVGCVSISERVAKMVEDGIDPDPGIYANMMSVMSDINQFCGLVKQSCISWGAKA